MTPNDKASGIIIRNLTKKDNKVLEHLRESFGTKFNSVAVMTASNKYLELTQTLETRDQEILRLNNKIEELNAKQRELKSAISAYFQFQEEKIVKDEQLLTSIKDLVVEPKPVVSKGKASKKVGSKSSRKGLSNLVEE